MSKKIASPEVKIEALQGIDGEIYFNVLVRGGAAVSHRRLASNVSGSAVAAIVAGICDRLSRGELVEHEKRRYAKGERLSPLDCGDAAEPIYGESTLCVPYEYFFSGFFMTSESNLARMRGR